MGLISDELSLVSRNMYCKQMLTHCFISGSHWHYINYINKCFCKLQTLRLQFTHECYSICNTHTKHFLLTLSSELALHGRWAFCMSDCLIYDRLQMIMCINALLVSVCFHHIVRFHFLLSSVCSCVHRFMWSHVNVTACVCILCMYRKCSANTMHAPNPPTHTFVHLFTVTTHVRYVFWFESALFYITLILAQLGQWSHSSFQLLYSTQRGRWGGDEREWVILQLLIWGCFVESFLPPHQPHTSCIHGSL